MNVIRWGAALAVALTTAAGLMAAPSAFAAGGVEAVGLSEHGSQIVAFNTSNPGGVRAIGTVKGLNGDRLIGIDFRPSDHALYGVTRGGGIYKIDTSTALATSVGKLSIAIDGGYWDIDFNAAGDVLRIITDKGQNLHQAFGLIGPSGPTVKDPKLSRSNIAALGYTGSNRGLGIDTGKRQIVTVDGATGKVAGLGSASAFPSLSTASNGIDIAGSNAFAVVNVNHFHTLYSVNTSNGTVQKVGIFNPEGDTAVAFKHVIDLSIRR